MIPMASLIFIFNSAHLLLMVSENVSHTTAKIHL